MVPTSSLNPADTVMVDADLERLPLNPVMNDTLAAVISDIFLESLAAFPLFRQTGSARFVATNAARNAFNPFPGALTRVQVAGVARRVHERVAGRRGPGRPIGRRPAAEQRAPGQLITRSRSRSRRGAVAGEFTAAGVVVLAGGSFCVHAGVIIVGVDPVGAAEIGLGGHDDDDDDDDDNMTDTQTNTCSERQ